MTEINHHTGSSAGASAEATTAPPGPGYWMASDGHWYPPEQRPGVSPPPAPAFQPQPTAYAAPASNGMATASMVLGIIAVVLFWAFGLSALLGILAIILGAAGLSKSNSLPNRTGRGQAIAGIVTGAVGVAAGVLMIAGIAAVSESINSDPADGYCDMDRFLEDPDC